VASRPRNPRVDMALARVRKSIDLVDSLA
jgi:hypothetical protein